MYVYVCGNSSIILLVSFLISSSSSSSSSFFSRCLVFIFFFVIYYYYYYFFPFSFNCNTYSVRLRLILRVVFLKGIISEHGTDSLEHRAISRFFFFFLFFFYQRSSSKVKPPHAYSIFCRSYAAQSVGRNNNFSAWKTFISSHSPTLY